MVQDLSDLATLGNANFILLYDINFDEFKLDQAANQAFELSVLQAITDCERKEEGSPKIVRDKPYTHLQGMVDEIYEAGKYDSGKMKAD